MAPADKKAELARQTLRCACILSQLAEQAHSLRLFRDAADLFEAECSLYPIHRRLLELPSPEDSEFPF